MPIHTPFLRQRLLAALLFILLLLAGPAARAQAVSAYGFSTGTGATLNPMVGATTAIGTGQSNVAAGPYLLGFTFVFNSANYLRFSVATNGTLRFGATTLDPVAAFPAASGNNVPGVSPASGPYSTGADGGVRYLLTGTAPNRILIVDWSLSLVSSGSADRHFQAWLSESTNTIRLVYEGGYTHNSSNLGCGAGIASSTAIHRCVDLGTNISNTNSVPEVAGKTVAAGRYFLFDPAATSPPSSPTAPTIGTVAPASGPIGTSVTLTGTNFTGTTSVRFGEISAPFVVNSSTQITATVPRVASTQKISVTNASDFALTASAFTVTRASSLTYGLVTSNFAGVSGSANAAPAVVDLDGDGMLDLLVGRADGTVSRYEQAAANSTTFTALGSLRDNTNTVIDAGTQATVCLVDLEGDGQFTLLLGRGDGTVSEYKQTAVGAATFALVQNNFAAIMTGTNTVPCATDLDGDGSLEMLVGKGDGIISHSEQNPRNTDALYRINTNFNNLQLPGNAAPFCTDLDGNGLLDVLVGISTGSIYRYEQTAAGSFTVNLLTTNFNNISAGTNAKLCVTDIDGDGMLDLLVGRADGTIDRYEQGFVPNTAPTDISLNPASVDENQPVGTVVGALGTTDANAGNTFAYTFATGGADNGSFNIAAGNITTNGVFNYEAKNSYSVKIRSTDQGGLFVEKTFTISVNNVNETPTVGTFTPTSGVPGTGVTINGTHFSDAGAVTVKFNGTTATAVTVSSNTQLTATVPTGASTGLIAVTNADGTGSSSTSFTVPAPNTTIVSGPPALTNNSTVSFQFSSDQSPVDYTTSGAPSFAYTGNGANSSFGPVPDGSYTLSVAAHNTVTNLIDATPATYNFTVDTQRPTVTITSTASSPTATSPIPVTVTFSENTTNFGNSNITVTGGTLTSASGSGRVYNLVITPTAAGTVTVSVAASVATDAAGNDNFASNLFSIQYAPVTLATVTTATPGSIAAISAVLGGNVSNAGGGTVTETGVVYLVGSGTPTTSNTKVAIGSGTGTFSQTVSGLAGNTTYSVRAYATNEAGTAYGSTLTFNTANRPPVAGSDSYIVAEDSGPTVFNVLLNDSDPDAGTTLVVTAVMQPANGSVTFISTGITFTPAVNFNGTTSFMYTIADGNGGTATGTVTVTVTAVNDAPVVTVPATQNTPFNTALTFSNANGNALSVADVDAGSGQVAIYLQGTQGGITLSTTAGLTFTSGSNGGGGFGFTGTLASINAALNGLSFLPNNGFSGAAALQLTVNDQGNTGSGGAMSDSKTVAINVATPINQAPVVTVPATQTAPFNTPLSFSTANGNALSVADADAGSGQLEVYIGVVNGTATLSTVSGLTFSSGSSGGGSMTFRGTLSTINAALNGLVFRANNNFSGAASLQVSANDLGNTGSGGAKSDSKTVTINVAANQAPVLVASSGSTSWAQGGGAVVLDAALTASDADNASLASALVSLTTGFVSGQDVLGFANANGITGSYNAGTGVLTLSGSASVATYQAALRSVTYNNAAGTPTGSSRTLSFVANDGSASSAATTKTLTLVLAPNTSIVNGPPALTNSRTVSFVFSSDQSPVEYATSGAPSFTYSNNGPNSSFGPVPDGSYTLSVAAHNTSTGLTDPTPATYNFTVDATAPTTTITSSAGASGGSTTTAPIPFTVTFSETVTGFVAGDVSVNNGSVTSGSFAAVSGTTYTFTVTPTTAGTATSVSVAAGVARDAAANGNAVSATYSLTYAPAPTITALSVGAELPGMPVVVTGTGFTSGSTVRFGGMAAASATFTSATSLTAVVPVGAAVGSTAVVVTTGGASSVSSPAFTVLKVYDAAANCLSTASYATTGDNAWHYLLATTGEVVAALHDTYAGLGTVSVSYLATGGTGPVRQNTSGTYYLDRNFKLTASGSPFAGTSVEVRFYGLTSELARLQGADASATYANLKATQYSGPNEDCDPSNNSATGQVRTLPLAASTPGNGVPWFVAQATVADHFSEFYLTGSTAPLPVELTAFTAEAKNAAVQLAWRTASEKSSAWFEIERSHDGQVFTKIGQQAAQGTKVSTTDYTFLDAQPGAAVVYYRLRQVDVDGTFSYSPVRSVAVGGKAMLALFPNPTTGVATLTGAQPGTLVQVYDALGREVLAATADATGSVALLLPSGLASGVYVVRLGATVLRLSVE